MFGMTKPVSVDRESISLSITDRPRKFYAPNAAEGHRTLHSEESLIQDLENYLILGDPGCGKTTLLKRITRRLILESPTSDGDLIDAPLVVLARDLHQSNTIFHHLCKIFGLEINSFDPQNHKIELERVQNVDRRRVKERELKNAWNRDADIAVRFAIMKFLAPSRFALLIDGIDEINVDYRARFEKDLDDIINTCPQLKIICTCRMGDWTRSTATLNILAIEAISDSEMAEIVHLWADKPDLFLAEVQGVPYREVLDRPLFLTLLLIIFNQGYKLPDCPVDVYERIIWLLIDRWDK